MAEIVYHREEKRRNVGLALTRAIGPVFSGFATVFWIKRHQKIEDEKRAIKEDPDEDYGSSIKLYGMAASGFSLLAAASLGFGLWLAIAGQRSLDSLESLVSKDESGALHNSSKNKLSLYLSPSLLPEGAGISVSAVF